MKSKRLKCCGIVIDWKIAFFPVMESCQRDGAVICPQLLNVVAILNFQRLPFTVLHSVSMCFKNIYKIPPLYNQKWSIRLKLLPYSSHPFCAFNLMWVWIFYNVSIHFHASRNIDTVLWHFSHTSFWSYAEYRIMHTYLKVCDGYVLHPVYYGAFIDLYIVWFALRNAWKVLNYSHEPPTFILSIVRFEAQNKILEPSQSNFIVKMQFYLLQKSAMSEKSL